ncbi:hypothetical protein SBDP1_130040 [Syntrophobacter sp. SbD1]|nr:hypothetical protein SBDP1_130040 [Syntrophobacter sp. SbD1]
MATLAGANFVYVRERRRLNEYKWFSFFAGFSGRTTGISIGKRRQTGP